MGVRSGFARFLKGLYLFKWVFLDKCHHEKLKKSSSKNLYIDLFKCVGDLDLCKCYRELKK